MGIELLVGVVGIVIATVISVWTYRKMNPKRQLRYRVEASPLLAAGAGAGERLTIEVQVQNTSVGAREVMETMSHLRRRGARRAH